MRFGEAKFALYTYGAVHLVAGYVVAELFAFVGPFVYLRMDLDKRLDGVLIVVELISF